MSPVSMFIATHDTRKYSAKKDSHRDSSTPPLLRLPAELRNAIYDYVFDPQTHTLGATSHVGVLAILRINRHLHAETNLLPYQSFTFSFNSISSLKNFINDRTPAQLAAVRRIQSRTILCDRMDGDHDDLSPGRLSSLEQISGLESIEVSDSVLQIGTDKATTLALMVISVWAKGERPGIKVGAYDRGKWCDVADVEAQYAAEWKK